MSVTKGNRYTIKFVKVSLYLFYCLLILETGLLVAEKVRQRQEFDQTNNLLYRDVRNKDHLYEFNPNLDLTIEGPLGNYSFGTNSEGLKEYKDYLNLDSSIILLGDSVAAGVSLSNEYAIDNYIESALGITTLNFAMPGSNTVQEYHYLIDKYRDSYNTKLIILGYCLNDYPQNTYRRYFNADISNLEIYDYYEGANAGTIQNIKDFLKSFRSLRLANTILKYSVDKITSFFPKSQSNGNQELKKVNDDYLDQVTLEYINKLKQFSESIDSKLLVVFLPSKIQFVDSEYFDFNNRIETKLISELSEEGISAIDLYDDFSRMIIENSPNDIFYDEVHFTQLGSNVASNSIINYIQSNIEL
ncbi:MAG: SGNH/GDSL hydrolase family protein [Gammaproteobacteria bacterium]|nr:SGNH/GDSL hydrolase family protein [Gammaproteobacteria bacterium]